MSFSFSGLRAMIRPSSRNRVADPFDPRSSFSDMSEKSSSNTAATTTPPKLPSGANNWRLKVTTHLPEILLRNGRLMNKPKSDRC